MITTREAKDNALRQPLEILDDLVQVFGPEGPRRIADIGACDGLSSIKYAMMFPRTIITAFEPREDNYLEMELNIKIYRMVGRICTRRTALGDHEERNVKFFESYGQAEWVKDTDTGRWSSSLLPPKEHLTEHTWCKFKESKANVTTLDSFLYEPTKLKPFDFLHVDVQGAEMQVFKGATESLKTVRAIWCEVANIELYAGQPRKVDILDFLTGRGFELTKDTSVNKKYGDCFFKR